MSDEEAFLAAIREHTDDAVLRLVYADWLEEHGDARHELIRVESAMREVPIWSDEFQRLKPARERLRKALPAEWLAAMDYLPKHRPMFGTLPPTAAERWRLAEEFIDIWHGGLKRGDGCTEAELRAAERELGHPLPAALRDWYRKAGRRKDIWSKQDHLLGPSRLEVKDGRLVFRAENQWCTVWYIRERDLGSPDPRVFGGDGNRKVADSVSAFMLLVLVYESQFRRNWCEVHPRPSGSQALSRRFRKTALPKAYWFQSKVAVWEAEDVFVIFSGDEWGYASCRTEAARDRLVAEFGERIVRL